MTPRFLTSIAVAAICVHVQAESVRAQPHPNMYLNAAEIAAIKAKVAANEQPWAQAYGKMLANADAALNQQPVGVTSQGYDGHDYRTEAPYDWSNNMPSPCGTPNCDGHINPKADRGDYKAATQIGSAVRALGMGYAFSGDARYADKAIELLDAWCLNDQTYMLPRYTNIQSRIELSITMPALFYGADLIRNYDGWGAAEQGELFKWANDFAQSALGWQKANNYDNWRVVVLATVGSLTDDHKLLEAAWTRWRELLVQQVQSDGHFRAEVKRTKSLDYSTFALSPMLQAAEIARHRGVDLYNYESAGKSIELVLDFHARYLANPSAWSYEQIAAYRGDNSAVYEIAYSIWGKEKYRGVIDKWGRPMWEDRVMGYTTLTHARSSGTISSAPHLPPPGCRGDEQHRRLPALQPR